MKRLVVCCDGTWQDAGRTFPTNVAKIAASIKSVARDGVVQCVYYAAGVGTNGWWNKLFGGGFGDGIDFNIKDAYRFLCLNYESGDEIYLFGFSRGSYTVRSLAGLIYKCGLLTTSHLDKIDLRDGEDAKTVTRAYSLYRSRKDKPSGIRSTEFRKSYCITVSSLSQDDAGRVPIHLLACFDTVGSLGIPHIGILNPRRYFGKIIAKLFGDDYRFHDTRLSRIILHAFHAVSIDEKRKVFNVTLMDKDEEKIATDGDVITVNGTKQKLYQTWFPGNHGSIGGGEERLEGLSNAPLRWMLGKIKMLKLGLDFDYGKMPCSPLHFNHLIAFYKPDLLEIMGQHWRRLQKDISFENNVHETAKRRWRDLKEYRPANIAGRFRKEMDAWIDDGQGENDEETGILHAQVIMRNVPA